jgi:hypothetical protein
MHECLHRSFGRPIRCGPERVPPIPKYSDREVAVGLRCLPRYTQRLNKERGQIVPRPNAKTCNGDDRHELLLEPECQRAPDSHSLIGSYIR